MSVNRQRAEGERLEALAAFANAEDEASIVGEMLGVYSVLMIEWEDRPDTKRNSRLLSHIHGRVNAWFATIVGSKKLESVIEEVGDLLYHDVKLHRAVYLRDKFLGRFEIATEGHWSIPQPLTAAIALAMLPLLDDTRDWRKRLKQCGYRNCKRYFFVTGKLSGQKFCSPGHGNIERVYKWRKNED